MCAHNTLLTGGAAYRTETPCVIANRVRCSWQVADGVGVGGDTLAEEVAATVAAIKAMQATSADARGADTQTGTIAAGKEKHD
eukprot:m.1190475 g.1190475  ORF g.1190475 m.1190475 type:complete len:83 (+) comp24555_c1_seq18:1539-1787(+)